MGHFFWVSFGQSSRFACFWVCIWYISGSSHMLHASFSQDRFLQRGPWVDWHHLFFDLYGTSLCVSSWEHLLDFENETYVVSIFYLGRGQLLSRSCCFAISVHRGQTSCLAWGPSISCLSLTSALKKSLWIMYWYIAVIENNHNIKSWGFFWGEEGFIFVFLPGPEKNYL